MCFGAEEVRTLSDSHFLCTDRICFDEAYKRFRFLTVGKQVTLHVILAMFAIAISLKTTGMLSKVLERFVDSRSPMKLFKSGEIKHLLEDF